MLFDYLLRLVYFLLVCEHDGDCNRVARVRFSDCASKCMASRDFASL